MKRIYNQIEKIIRIISVLTFIGGLIASVPFIFESVEYSDFDDFLIAAAIITGSFISAVFTLGFSVVIEKMKEGVSNQDRIIKLLERDACNSDNCTVIKGNHSVIENSESIDTGETDEDFAVVNIKLLSDFQRKADIENNTFIMVGNEKKYIAGMKKGEVIEYKVPVGSCEISVGNNITPLLDTICFEVRKGKIEVVVLKSTAFGYLLGVL